MARGLFVVLVIVVFTLVSGLMSVDDAMAKGKYLVKGSGGPAPGSPAEAIALLENLVIPTFDILMKWEKDGKIVGGLPVGDRAFVMIVNAESNHEVDRMLRSLPLWPRLNWKVVPLESTAGRAEIEREIVQQLKESTK